MDSHNQQVKPHSLGLIVRSYETSEGHMRGEPFVSMDVATHRFLNRKIRCLTHVLALDCRLEHVDIRQSGIWGSDFEKIYRP